MKNNFLRKEIKTENFEKCLYEWLEQTRVSVKAQTYQKYKFLIDNHINPHLGKYDFKELTADKINDFILYENLSGRKDMKGGLSSGYINTMCHIINSATKNILKEKVKSLPVKKKQIEYLTLFEQKIIENYIVKNEPIKGVGILLSLYTGLRLGEVCALRISDIDFYEKTVKIDKTVVRVKNQDAGNKTIKIIDTAKTENANRIIPVPLKIIDILKKISKNKYVLEGKNGSFCDTRTYQYYFKKVLKKCGIRDIKYHSLRHTFATRCIESGVDVKTLSEILGHSDVNVTLNTYVHITLKHKQIQLKKMLEFCK